jgi:hypothetical protein
MTEPHPDELERLAELAADVARRCKAPIDAGAIEEVPRTLGLRARRRRRRQCANPALQGSDYCSIHQPGPDERRRRLRLGGF